MTQKEKIINKLIYLLKNHGVSNASIFGSFARGEMKKNSDIDLLIKFKGAKSLLDLAGLKLILEDSLGRKVDLLTYNSLHPLLKDRILREQEKIL